jgi:3-methyladenine DNA glycosylase AlkC
MFFPDFVEQFGLEEEEISLYALEEFTKTSSAEFAIRPFIVRNQEKTLRVYNNGQLIAIML